MKLRSKSSDLGLRIMIGPWILTSKGGKVLDWNREGSEFENHRCVMYFVQKKMCLSSSQNLEMDLIFISSDPCEKITNYLATKC